MHVTTSQFLSRIVRSLVWNLYFFSERPLYGNYSILDSYTNTVSNVSRGCLLIKALIRPITEICYPTSYSKQWWHDSHLCKQDDWDELIDYSDWGNWNDEDNRLLFILASLGWLWWLGWLRWLGWLITRMTRIKWLGQLGWH